MNGPLAWYILIIALSWALSVTHGIYAHRVSPEASLTRPFWRNRYSPRGRGHLRIFLFWAIVAIVLMVLHFRS